MNTGLSMEREAMRESAIRVAIMLCAALLACLPSTASAQSQTGGLPALTSRVDTLETAVAAQQTTLTTLQTTLTTLQTSVTALQGGFANVQSSITGLQGSVASIQSSISVIQSAVNSLQSANNSLLNALNTLGTRVTALEQTGTQGTPVAFSDSYTVPAGKRLRIDTVSGSALGGAGDNGLWVLHVELTSGGNDVHVSFVPLVERTSRGEQWRFHQVTSLMADPGSQVAFSNQCSGCPGSIFHTVTGVLLDE